MIIPLAILAVIILALALRVLMGAADTETADEGEYQ